MRHDIEKQSLTFEETMEDFEVVNQDVVTQVIHLEYFVLDDEYFLYQVLDTYLENKELISEYFSKILQSV